MTRYIDADALLEERGMGSGQCNERECTMGNGIVRHAIMNQ